VQVQEYAEFDNSTVYCFSLDFTKKTRTPNAGFSDFISFAKPEWFDRTKVLYRLSNLMFPDFDIIILSPP
jgi:hypothetical protein